MPSTIIEPFRIKMIEPIELMTAEARQQALIDAKFNTFLLPAVDVAIDLLTDSGTGAMSAQQWAHLMLGDESYAGSRSWYRFEETVKDITGMKHVLPTHQGRAAEHILMHVTLKPGMVVPNNNHFDTTRANIEFVGGVAVDCPSAQLQDGQTDIDFKGNIDLEKLEACITKHGADNIPFAMITITNNTGGGQPVALANIKATKQLLKKHNIPLIIDACRFAENAYFIKQREDGYQDKTLTEIALEIFSHADAATMSCKKDGIANTGGFFVCNDDDLAERFKHILILQEGFPTYGGLAGRDLECIAVGLREVLTHKYQVYRHATVKYLAEALDEIGIPYIKPVGGHAVFIDAKALLPHIKPTELPGIALVNELYLTGGVRSCEIGTLMFGKYDDNGNMTTAPQELVRLAIPRRVYTQSHFDYLIEVLQTIWQHKDALKGYRIEKEAPFLRHFTAHLSPL